MSDFVYRFVTPDIFLRNPSSTTSATTTISAVLWSRLHMVVKQMFFYLCFTDLIYMCFTDLKAHPLFAKVFFLTLSKFYRDFWQKSSQVLVESPKQLLLLFLRMKSIIFPARSKFPVKSICSIDFGSASSSCCLPKSAAIFICFLK